MNVFDKQVYNLRKQQLTLFSHRNFTIILCSVQASSLSLLSANKKNSLASPKNCIFSPISSVDVGDQCVPITIKLQRKNIRIVGFIGFTWKLYDESQSKSQKANPYNTEIMVLINILKLKLFSLNYQPLRNAYDVKIAKGK
jgi:hypothetical protein